MEVPGGKQNIGYVLLFETIGTANLLYAINTSSHGNWQPFSIGLTIFGNICMFGNVSGGHFNPAVTLGVLIAEGRKDFADNILYAIAIIFAQLVGAILGCLSTMLSQYYLPEHLGIAPLMPGIATLKPISPSTLEEGMLQSFWTEIVMTTFFVSVILSAKYINGAKDLFLNALVIGLTLFCCVVTGGGVSGGCYNPAVGLVQIVFQNVVQAQADNFYQSYNYYWVYPASSALGGIIAGLFLHISRRAHNAVKVVEVAKVDERARLLQKLNVDVNRTATTVSQTSGR